MVTFARNEKTGAVRLRRNYVLHLTLGKDRSIVVVAEQDNGIWSNFNFLISDGEIGNARKSTRVYARGAKP